MWRPHSNIWNTSFLRRTSRWLSLTSNEALLKLFHCSVRNTRAIGWLGMAHRTSGLNIILVPRVNCRPAGRFFATLSATFPLSLCSRLRFFEPKDTTSTLCICESSYHDLNCWRARVGGIGYYSTMCIKLAVFYYIMTVQKVVYVLCTNLYTPSKL
jgi:hypothetical protein